VLSLGKLAPGQHAYYVDSVARGAEEYYTGAKEAPGAWVGAGSEALGLAGQVDGERLGNLLRHADPSGTWRLTSSGSVPTVAAFDATFCAPKSVSVLHALGDGEVSNEVRNAADAAVRESVQVLEQVACRVRRGAGGSTVLDGDGFVGAAFRHRTSRAGDPHLHTHVVIANVAHSPVDDRWTALDARALYAWAAPVGYLYEAHLRWELTRRLGVAWGPVRNGIADVAGIPQPVLREFSTRRREIEAHLAEHGQHTARAAQVATYATRCAKTDRADPAGLLRAWRARAQTLGLDGETLTGVLDRAFAAEPPTPGSAGAEQLYRWLASPDGLTSSHGTFGQRDVIKAVCNRLPSGGRVDQVLDLVDGFLRSEHVVPVRVDDRAAVMYRRDGTVVAARTDEYRWTTPEMLETETRLLAAALARRGTGTGVADDTAIQTALDTRPSLTGEQARMVQTICASGDGVEIVEGVAGAGKTFALAAARDAWTASGYQVIGCSLAARAAQQLEDDAAIPASTIDRLLAGITRRTTTLDDTTVVVVDEAAMVGTRTLGRLLTHAQTARTKVVLVGDPCQLPEIEAGGTFAGLQDRLGASHLTDNRRQTAAWERTTLAELRAGDPDRAFDDYLEHDRAHHAASDTAVRDQLVDAWMTARVDGGNDVLMVAARLADVDDLNRRARYTLRDEGHLGDDQVVLGGRPFAEGDTVLALRNDYPLGVLNGTRATVERIDIRRHELTLAVSGRERLVVPFAYAEAGHLTHGYATTIHKAQGATVDRCYVLADDTLTREHAYTALSRGRHGNELYAAAADRRADERHAVEVEPDQLAAIRHALGRSAAKQMAVDQHEPQITRLEQLQAERDGIRARLGSGPPDPTHEYRQLSEAITGARQWRDNARWRLDTAHRSLNDLAPIRRMTHHLERRELEHRIDDFSTEVSRYEQKLADLERQRSKVEPVMRTRQRWEARHGTDLGHLDTLDRQIDITERLDRIASRTPDRDVDHGIDIGM
jgi:conjugative relaxase-like TrwC/TraI family protein